MGIQDRDYYREWWRKKTGYVEKASFRVPFPNGEDDGGAYLREQQKSDLIFLSRTGKTKVEENRSSDVHPVLIFLMLASICLAVYLVLRMISKLPI